MTAIEYLNSKRFRFSILVLENVSFAMLMVFWNPLLKLLVVNVKIYILENINITLFA